MNRPFLRLMGLCLMLPLGACGGKSAPDLYVLRVPESVTPYACTQERTLIVERPTAAAEYATTRIAVMQEHGGLTYYTGAAWASPFPDQLQNFLADMLETSGAYRTVTTDRSEEGVRLSIAIRQVTVDHANAPVAHLRLTARLSDMHSGKRLAKVVVNETIPASENHMPDIADAFNTAALHAATKIAEMQSHRCNRSD